MYSLMPSRALLLAVPRPYPGEALCLARGAIQQGVWPASQHLYGATVDPFARTHSCHPSTLWIESVGLEKPVGLGPSGSVSVSMRSRE